jgi:hypothetical protein
MANGMLSLGDLTDVDLDLAATAGNDARLKVTETVVPVGRPARALRFDLDRTIYAPVGRNLATRTARATRVTDEKGRELAFEGRIVHGRRARGGPEAASPEARGGHARTRRPGLRRAERAGDPPQPRGAGGVPSGAGRRLPPVQLQAPGRGEGGGTVERSAIARSALAVVNRVDESDGSGR